VPYFHLLPREVDFHSSQFGFWPGSKIDVIIMKRARFSVDELIIQLLCDYLLCGLKHSKLMGQPEPRSFKELNVQFNNW
jgi:hypothetical protein